MMRARCVPAWTVLLAAILGLAPLSLRAGEELFTPAHVARLRAVVEAAPSPDGSLIAYVASVPRRPWEDDDGNAWAELRVVDAAGDDRPFVTGQVNVESVEWAPDGRSITFLAKRGDDEHQALYRIPVGGGEARKVAGHDEDIQAYALSPDGSRAAFLAQEKLPAEVKKRQEKGFDQRIFEEDLRPARVWVTTLDQEEAEPRMLDLEGHASAVRWGRGGDKLLVVLAPTPLVDDSYTSRKIVLVDAGSGAVVARVDNAGKLGDAALSPDGTQVAFLGGQDPTDPAPGRLMVASASGGAPRELLPGAEFDFQALAWQDSGTLVYIAGQGVWTRVGAIAPDGSGDRTLVPPGRPTFASVHPSRDGKALVLVGDSPGHPSEVFLLKAGDPEPVRLTDSNPWLQGMRLAGQEVVTYRARDGLELQGILVPPLDPREGERVPLVLIVHGGPESHDDNGWLTSYSRPAQVLAARGFAAFLPNYRGSTGRGLAFARLSQGDAAGAEFDDLVDAVDHLVARGLVDRDKVGITGGSYGGYASAWGATYYSDRFAASVMFVGISNKISKVGATDIPNEEMYAHAQERVWDNWQKYLERSPIYHAGKSRTPTLILHGDSDPRVHPSQSLELYRHLKLRSQAPVRLVFYKGEGHGNRRAASRYDYSLRLIQWMEHYLKGPGGDPPPYEIDYGFADEDEDDEDDAD